MTEKYYWQQQGLVPVLVFALTRGQPVINTGAPQTETATEY